LNLPKVCFTNFEEKNDALFKLGSYLNAAFETMAAPPKTGNEDYYLKKKYISQRLFTEKIKIANFSIKEFIKQAKIAINL
jgi:hypothetical protein